MRVAMGRMPVGAEPLRTGQQMHMRVARALQTTATCCRFPALQLDRFGGSLKSRQVAPRATPP